MDYYGKKGYTTDNDKNKRIDPMKEQLDAYISDNYIPISER